MQDKKFLQSLRVLMAAGSVGGFIGGWALLAQTGKPSVSESPTPVPALTEPASMPSAADLIAITPTATTSAATPAAKTAASPTQTKTPQPTATKIQVVTRQSSITAQPKLKTGGS